MGKILVIGSMNMDLVVKTANYPQKGETIIGQKYFQVPGGKGANQALTIGKLGGDVSFIGACGDDYFGGLLLESLTNGGVRTEDVIRVQEPTGIASITVEENGDNRIVIVKGANDLVSVELIRGLKEQIFQADIILLQLEIPLETVQEVMDVAKKSGTIIILDPAPAQRLPEEIYPKIDYLLPNQGELDQLVTDPALSTPDKKARELVARGVGAVLLTKGEAGVSLYTKDREEKYPAYPVHPVDTTAAGDAFAGAFAYGLQQKWDEEKSIHFANLVAALSVTRLGAQSSLPELTEVLDFEKEIGASL